MKKVKCLLCSHESDIWKNIDGYDYYICSHCKTIFIDPEIVDKIDNDINFSIRKYNEDYWEEELSSSVERSWGGIGPDGRGIILCQDSCK